MDAFSVGSSIGSDARCTRLRCSSGQALAGLSASAAARRRPRDRRPRRRPPDRRRSGGRRCSPAHGSAKPRITPSGSLSASQRETWSDDRTSGGQRPRFRTARPGGPRDSGCRPGAEVEYRPRRPRSARSRALRSTASTVARVELLVLRGEHVDRGRDHGDPVRIEALPGKRLAARTRTRRPPHVGVQELPSLAGELRWAGRARRGSARSPPRPAARNAAIRPAGLRVVDDHHVARTHPFAERRQVVGQRLLVDRRGHHRRARRRRRSRRAAGCGSAW